MTALRFLSLFSGAGGFDLGLHRAGWACVGQCEVDAWRRGILARHWPDVPRWDDVTTLDPEGIECDLIAGGFPCQDVSVAGRRKGLAGERTGLFWHAMRIVDAVRPRFVLLENVPGLLTSNGGRDFGVVLGALADLGYGVGWRVLDSRYFGVPQRRRRVFILGALPGGRAGAERAGAILALGTRCERHSSARPEAGKGAATHAGDGAGVAGALDERASKGPNGSADEGALIVSALDRQRGGPDDNAAQGGHLVPTLAHTLRSEGFDASEDGTGRGTPLVAAMNLRGRDGGAMPEMDHLASLRAASGGSSRSYAASCAGVRRLTPVECCRLQGFPDDWFGKPNERPDGPRYAALGDAVTVNVAEWLGGRLMAHAVEARAAA